MLSASDYDFSKALWSGAAIFSLSQYRTTSTPCGQSFSPSPANELQTEKGTSQPGTSQTGMASLKTMSGMEHQADFRKKMVSSLTGNTPSIVNGVHSILRLIVSLINTVQKGGDKEEMQGVDCAQGTDPCGEVYYPPHQEGNH